MSTPIDIEIDGKKITTVPGAMVIEAADEAGIHIPRFCYHKKLSVAANCRMCLVEVEKIPKPVPACATSVTAGMKIYTQSSKALEAQRTVMEFLLINHPLDCPICDQGGACELQDISLGYGQDFSRYEETKRVVKDEDLGSLIATDMTRCIQCTRCVRFGQEIAGIRELGTLGRGDRTEIGSYLKGNTLKSELSGNIIDLCPVGALTSKPFRYSARPWELNQYASIAPHDAVGSNIFVHTRRQKVMRIIPRENEQINETWLADRDRFSYEGLYSDKRLLQPMLKQNGTWIKTDWTTALDFAAKQLYTISHQSAEANIAALLSPNVTLEECYLFHKLLKGLGSSAVDYRLRQTTTHELNPSLLGLPLPIEQLQEQSVILLIGTHLNHEQPLLAHRLRKAFLQGAKILIVNPADFTFAFNSVDKRIVAPSQLPVVLQAMLEQGLFAEPLASGDKKLILLGELALNHPQAKLIQQLAEAIGQKYQMSVGCLMAGANSQGAEIAKAIVNPQSDCTVYQALQANLKSYILYGFEPDLDCANPLLIQTALSQAECVIAFSAYHTEALLKYAQVLLPIAPFAETAGTFVNAAGTWQSFAAITPPLGQAKPTWKILRVLGNLLKLPEFNYQTIEEILAEITLYWQQRTISPATSAVIDFATSNVEIDDLERIAEWPLYRSDALVRHGSALQAAAANESVAVRLHPVTANRYRLQSGQVVTVRQGQGSATLAVQLDETIPINCGLINAGFAETANLPELFGTFIIEQTHA